MVKESYLSALRFHRENNNVPIMKTNMGVLTGAVRHGLVLIDAKLIEEFYNGT